MSSFPAKLKGGRYDGDHGDIGFYPPFLWAITCPHPEMCAIRIHWVPHFLDPAALKHFRDTGLEPLLYVRDRMEQDGMLYILDGLKETLSTDEGEWTELGTTDAGGRVLIKT